MPGEHPPEIKNLTRIRAVVWKKLDGSLALTSWE